MLVYFNPESNSPGMRHTPFFPEGAPESTSYPKGRSQCLVRMGAGQMKASRVYPWLGAAARQRSAAHAYGSYLQPSEPGTFYIIFSYIKRHCSPLGSRARLFSPLIRATQGIIFFRWRGFPPPSLMQINSAYSPRLTQRPLFSRPDPLRGA